MNFSKLIQKAKLRLLKMHYECNIGHLGGNLSALDAMLFLHSQIMQDKDVFVLSKGHSAGALYIVLWAVGKLDEENLAMFHKDGAKLAGHPVAGWHKDISFSTGSLGHGVGLAAGCAYAKKLKGEPGSVFCMTSDGEWEEGSNWEALMFIAHHRLENLTLLIDANGLQGFGRTADIASLDPLINKIRGFDITPIEIDGHDPEALLAAFNIESDRPKVIILHTVKGYGISYMENSMEWHYLPMTESQYIQAMLEIEQKE